MKNIRSEIAKKIRDVNLGGYKWWLYNGGLKLRLVWKPDSVKEGVEYRIMEIINGQQG